MTSGASGNSEPRPAHEGSPRSDDGSLPQGIAAKKEDTALSNMRRAISILSALTLGLAVNSISDAYKGLGPVSCASSVLVLAAVAYYLRRRAAPRSPIRTYTARIALVGAAIAVILSLLVPTPYRGWFIFAAASLAALASLTRGSLSEVASSARIISFVGVGFSNALSSAIGLIDDEIGPSAIGGIGFGLSAIALGLSFRDPRSRVAGLLCFLAGIALVAGGIYEFFGAHLLLGMATVAFGIAAGGAGVSLTLGSTSLLGAALLALGFSLELGGAAKGLASGWLLGSAVAGVGAASLVAGTALFRASNRATIASLFFLGGAACVLGIGMTLSEQKVVGISVIAAGTATVLASAVKIARATGLQIWWRNLLLSSE